jgi:hypothetical protein
MCAQRPALKRSDWLNELEKELTLFSRKLSNRNPEQTKLSTNKVDALILSVPLAWRSQGRRTRCVHRTPPMKNNLPLHKATAGKLRLRRAVAGLLRASSTHQ